MTTSTRSMETSTTTNTSMRSMGMTSMTMTTSTRSMETSTTTSMRSMEMISTITTTSTTAMETTRTTLPTPSPTSTSRNIRSTRNLPMRSMMKYGYDEYDHKPTYKHKYAP